MSLLRIDALHVGFRNAQGTLTPVVKGVNLEVDAGTCVAVVGESGAGKTLTARAVTGLLPHGACESARNLRN